MPITTVHPHYRNMSESWIDCRTAFEGQRAVKAAGNRYLPALTGQTTLEYEAYKGRALFYSITSKTLSALAGMVLDQPPELTHPPRMDPYFDDGPGVQFYEAFTEAVQELLLMGRFGILIDRPAGGGAPYLVLYTTECITNWRKSDDGQLEMVVLKEGYVDRDSRDEYESVEKIRYRKLEIIDGTLWVSVFIQGAPTSNDYTETQPTTVTNTGVPMNFIPFFCVTAAGMDITPVKPPMLDIVDINFSHYRTSADLEHGRHFTGLPTPYVIGAESQSKMHIGSTTAWVIPDPSAKVGFLEFTGQGLQSLEKALAEKQSQLASLSARLIDNSTRGSEAAETVKLRYLSETASLRMIVRAAQALLNKVYKTIATMEGLAEDSVNIVLSTNFLDSKLTAAELKAWTEAYLKRAVTKEMLIHALKTGKSLPPPGEELGEIPDPPAPKTESTNSAPTSQE